MAFINQAVTVLQTLVIALGAGLAVWGVVNLMEGYGKDKTAHGWRWRRSHWHYAHSLAVHTVLIKQAQLNRKVVEYWAVS